MAGALNTARPSSRQTPPQTTKPSGLTGSSKLRGFLEHVNGNFMALPLMSCRVMFCSYNNNNSNTVITNSTFEIVGKHDIRLRKAQLFASNNLLYGVLTLIYSSLIHKYSSTRKCGVSARASSLPLGIDCNDGVPIVEAVGQDNLRDLPNLLVCSINELRWDIRAFAEG